MDLIYANQNKEDIGVLQFYKLDMAYGVDENNFELELNLSEHCMDYGYYIYAENTEYGGIVDTIYVDNGSKIVKYKGRTWHGILDNSVILPDDDYLVVSGEANSVVAELIERQGLGDMFYVSNEDSEITVEYAFRYESLYQGILEMLKQYQGKLSVKWKNGKVELSCHLAIDFTNDDEWDSSQLEFEISQNSRPTNHLVCLGQGDLKNRAVIHLFCDADGNIQQYAINDKPMEDADYILDESQKVMSGVDEVAKAYDYPSAEVLTTYIALEFQPDDYFSNHESYFKKNDNDYKNLEITQQEQYNVLASQPNDWNTNFGSYYVKQGDDYKAVSSVTSELYQALSSKPSDWDNNYGNYYLKDGDDYETVSSETKYTYKKLTEKPSDWNKNFGDYYTFNGVDYDRAGGDSKSYYEKHTGKPSDWDDEYAKYYWKVPKYGIKKANNKQGYEIYVKSSVWMSAENLYVVDQEKVKEWKKASGTKKDKININELKLYVDKYKKKPKWKKDTYYNRENKSIAPKFRKNYYYSLSTSKVAPSFVANSYYLKKVVVSAPTFAANTYYAKAIVDVYEEFVAGLIYRQSEDRYATLVEDGIKKLREEFAEKDSVNVELEELQEYDINDIVGARENVTGIAAKHYISKKIIKITNGVIKIDYTIGKE